MNRKDCWDLAIKHRYLVWNIEEKLSKKNVVKCPLILSPHILGWEASYNLLMITSVVGSSKKL
jgi:hypothetical protein